MPADSLDVSQEREVKYLFGRLNIVYYQADLFKGGYNKAELINHGISAASIELPPYTWGFYNIQQLIESGYVTGFIVKYRPETETTTVDETTRTINYRIENNLIRARSRFFLHIESGLLIYHPVSGDIDSQVFRNRFLDLFHKAFNGQAQAEISSVDDQYQVLNEFATFDTISKVSIELVPSNPSFTDLWRPVDDRMKSLKLAKHKEIYVVKNTDSGDALKSDDLIRAKISMAEDGYGNASITGTKQGRTKTIHTKDMPVFATVWQDEADEPDSILSKLSGKITEVFARFNQ